MTKRPNKLLSLTLSNLLSLFVGKASSQGEFLLTPGGATTFSIKTLGIMGLFATLGIMGLFATLSILHLAPLWWVSRLLWCYAECRYAECRYAECRNYFNVMLSVVMLNVVILSVVAPSWPYPQIKDSAKNGGQDNALAYSLRWRRKPVLWDWDQAGNFCWLWSRGFYECWLEEVRSGPNVIKLFTSVNYRFL